MKPALVIRADAGTSIGRGHVMRCLALAQAWQDGGGRVCLVSAGLPGDLAGRLTAEGVGVVALESRPGGDEDARETAGVVAAEGAGWLVADGYHLGARHAERAREAGARGLLVDDNGRTDAAPWDLVLNHNVYAVPGLYPGVDPGRLLLGPGHVLLRREFRRAPRRPPGPGVRRLLLTMGGADEPNATLRLLRALRRPAFAELRVAVLVGGSNPHAEALRREAPGPGAVIRLLPEVLDVHRWIAWADAVLCAAGTTVYEVACLGRPACLVVLADNQWGNERELLRLGAAGSLGWHGDLTEELAAEGLGAFLSSPEALARSAERLGRLTDGRGASRVAAALGLGDLALRRAGPSDARLLWEWANDPAVRGSAVHGEPIPWETHGAWFDRKLADPAVLALVAVRAPGVPVGQVRFDLEGGRARVDVSVASGARGQGLGARLLALGVEELRRTGFGGAVEAEVRPENAASRGAFERAGFASAGTCRLEGVELLRYRLEPEEEVSW